MKIPLTIKQIIWLLIVVVTIVFLLSGVTQAIVVFARIGADWVSALIQLLGNIIGGILGGVVAIIVATYQINRTFQNESNNKLKTSNTMLKLIREEFKNNITILESVIPYSSQNHTILKTELSDDIWKSTILHLVITDHLLVRLNVGYRKTCLFKNLTPNEISDDLLKEVKEQMNQSYMILNEEIRKLDEELGD